jgi:hypothetical protein
LNRRDAALNLTPARAQGIFWQRKLPIHFSRRFQLPYLNRARFFG